MFFLVSGSLNFFSRFCRNCKNLLCREFPISFFFRELLHKQDDFENLILFMLFLTSTKDFTSNPISSLLTKKRGRHESIVDLQRILVAPSSRIKIEKKISENLYCLLRKLFFLQWLMVVQSWQAIILTSRKYLQEFFPSYATTCFMIQKNVWVWVQQSFHIVWLCI